VSGDEWRDRRRDWRDGAWGPGGPWPRRRGPTLALPVIVGAIQIIGTNIAASRQLDVRPLDQWAYLLLLCGPLALIVRRRWPVPVLVIATGATAAFLALDYPRGPFFLAGLVALFGAVRRGPRPAVWTVCALAYAGYLAAAISLGTATWGTALGAAAWLAVAVALAEAAKVRAAHFAEVGRSMAEAKRAAAEAERAKQEQARRQAADERLRIAQELHDVLGHHLSLINMRAGVALHLLDSQPEQAREALGAIKVASSEALREVRGVLAALRPAEESAPRSPTPGLDQVEELAEGLPVSVERVGAARPLPSEVDRAAYRIVQESLTNVRRHAGPGARVTVTLAYGDDELTVTVADDGAGAGTTTAEGNGIPGMRERAAALGGRLSAGPPDDGKGFEVVAKLPIRPAEDPR